MKGWLGMPVEALPHGAVALLPQEGAASVALWQAWAVLEAKQGDKAAVRYLFKKALGANPRSRWVVLAVMLPEQRGVEPLV